MRYDLHGMGKLEMVGYCNRWESFNGRFVDNKKQGQASLVKKDAEGNDIFQFEGLFTDDMPEGQG